MAEESKTLTFHIVTPYRGPDNWLQECIKSVETQTLSAVHHVIIDTENKGACRNHFEALQGIEPVPSNIVIHLDGDDKFAHERALETLQAAYRDPEVWATYGNYVSDQGSVCRPMDSRGFRESIIHGGWCWSHPRTFRAHLIPHLKEEDMKDSQGEWYSSAPDVAIFLPILEMAGKPRVRFIDCPLVWYRIHENNEHASRERLQDQVRCAVELFHKKPYEPITILS